MIAEARQRALDAGGFAQCTNCGGAKMFHQPEYQPIVSGILDKNWKLRRNLPCKEFSSKFVHVVES